MRSGGDSSPTSHAQPTIWRTWKPIYRETMLDSTQVLFVDYVGLSERYSEWKAILPLVVIPEGRASDARYHLWSHQWQLKWKDR